MLSYFGANRPILACNTLELALWLNVCYCSLCTKNNTKNQIEMKVLLSVLTGASQSTQQTKTYFRACYLNFCAYRQNQTLKVMSLVTSVIVVLLQTI